MRETRNLSYGRSRKAKEKKFNKRRVQFEQQRKVKEDLYNTRDEDNDEEDVEAPAPEDIPHSCMTTASLNRQYKERRKREMELKQQQQLLPR